MIQSQLFPVGTQPANSYLQALTPTFNQVVKPYAALTLPADTVHFGHYTKNTDLAKKAAIIDTEKFQNAFTQTLEKAKAFLERHTKQDKDIVIFDLDDTLMDNRRYSETHDEFTNESWASWILDAQAPPIQKTLTFYQWVKEQGYPVFFITSRDKSWEEATINNLKSEEFQYNIDPEDLKRIRYRDLKAHKTSVDFKTAERKKLHDEDYNILLSLGDQQSDMPNPNNKWESHTKGFLLPNFYTVE